MPKRVCAVLVLSGLVAAGSASAATSPHAKARVLLDRCLTALGSFPIVKIESKATAARRNVKARHVDVECSVTLPLEPLARAHRHDRALQDAYDAGIKLNYAVGDYVQYVLGVSSGRQQLSLLHRSQREVAAARHATHVALRELA